MDRTRVNAIFTGALARPAAERAAYLDRACGADGALRAEVEALLAAGAAADDALRPPTDRDLGRWLSRPDAMVGRRVANCTLTRCIGRGGMGVVYEAEQDQPRRTVAVKLMRGAVATEESRARFRHEIRVLGNLRHPGIAQIHSAGTDDAGLPYFVMEFVPNARSLTAHCGRLDTRQRIELFAGVCDAVHFGHLKGVVHRDLKPDNMLVDPGGAAKVIDFGIAKITDPDLAQTRQLTRTGEVFGTLAYLSPEQLAGDAAAVDARTDVYALGVVLYELLAGELPYELAGLDLLGAAKVIAQQPPRMPAAGGDLDVILSKALAKEADRRYPSAAALKADLDRCLRGEPIEARPASVTYKLKLFARRHRGAVAAGAVAVVALVAGTVVSLVLAARAREERDLAQQEARRARGLLLESQKVVGVVLGDLYDGVAGLPGSLELRALVAARVQESLDGLALHAGDDPELRRLTARHYSRLGDVYGLHGTPNLGETKRALQNQERAVSILEALESAAPDNERYRLDLALARSRAADLHYRLGGHARAGALETRALTALATMPQDEAVRRLSARIHVNAGERLASLGRGADAVASFGKAADLARSLLKSHRRDPSLLTVLSRACALRGGHLAILGRAEEAQASLRESLDALDRARQLLGSDRMLRNAYGVAHHNAGLWDQIRGAVPEALEHFEKAAGHQRRAAAAEPGDRRVRANLASTLERICRMQCRQAVRLLAETPARRDAIARIEAAVRAGREAVATLEKLHAADPANRLYALDLCRACHTLAQPLLETMKWEDAEGALRRGLDLARELMERGPEDADGYQVLIQAWAGLGRLYLMRAAVARREDAAAARKLAGKARAHYARARDLARGGLAEGVLPERWARRMQTGMETNLESCDRLLGGG